MRPDWGDVAVVLGLGLVGSALYVAWGTAAVLAYAGVVLVIVGLVVAVAGRGRTTSR